MRRALAHFPVPEIAQRVLSRYFFEGGNGSDEQYKLSEMPRIDSGTPLIELTIVANFAEVWLAKEGHDGLVGVNYLEKIQIPTLPSLLGAMLADVDYVLMGAGIPRFIPGVLDAFAEGKPAELRLDVEDAAAGEHFACELDPAAVLGMTPKLRRPKFVAIISSSVLATTLARKSNGHVDGFVIEGATAGGHNAPPRGVMTLSAAGEPIYGERDDVDLEKIRELGLPFWLAGGFAEPERIREALAAGAQGVQVGTAFAFCAESSISEDIKLSAIQLSDAGTASVFTDPRASPTGFPFKVLNVAGTHSDPEVYLARRRVCDLGYLRRLYRRPDGQVGYRCPAEPIDAYIAKGGAAEETVGRKCLCNALFATIGLGQHLPGQEIERALVTAGDDAIHLSRFVPPGQQTYTARDVVEYLLPADAGASSDAVPEPQIIARL